ncbi:MAG: ORF6N domain-containing protein [Prevotella sp.]|nr:ORF6N domain-containing protein [Prevotella sp.]
MEKQLEPIRNKIYEIRGQRVMLDFDLATMYGVETSQLKRSVRRNIRRFEGDDFMMELSHSEIMRCQIGTSSWGGSRYGAFAFTEMGVAMLSSILRSETAIEVNREIMRAFVAFRHITTLPDNSERFARIESEINRIKQEMEESLADQNDINESTRAQLDAISEALAELQPREPKPRRRIGFIQEER